MRFYEEGGMTAGHSVDLHPTGREAAGTARIEGQVHIGFPHEEYGKTPRIRTREVGSSRC